MVRIPRIRAVAMDVIVTAPKEMVRPPIPAMRITEAVNRFLFWLRSTCWSILRPETAMKP